MKAVIDVQGLCKVYRSGLLGRRSLTALADVTFRVEPGEIFGLLGPNGAGKTTFIKLLLGIVRRSEGQATLFGQAVGTRSSRRRIGYLPEQLRFPRHHTAHSVLELYGKLGGLSGLEVRNRRDQLLESVGLADRTRESVRRFSKGMMQRLGLAQAMLHNPDLLIMDEPTDGLDPVGRSYVRNVLLDLKSQGKTIFLNSHILQEVEIVCDRVAILDRGVLKRIGSVDEIAEAGPANARVQLELTGTEQDVRRALQDADIVELTASANGRFKVLCGVDNQVAVDQLVDVLRANGISIASMAPVRVSLEDAFLEIVSKQKGVAK